jgi:hypothetical protein
MMFRFEFNVSGHAVVYIEAEDEAAAMAIYENGEYSYDDIDVEHSDLLTVTNASPREPADKEL